LPTAEGLALEASVVVVAAGLTVCARVDEVLARKLESPLYFAEIECEPGSSEVAAVERDATPPERVALPSEVLPTKNVTLPVGVPEYAGDTVAVNVTD
jgi:hypothetical protein